MSSPSGSDSESNKSASPPHNRRSSPETSPRNRTSRSRSGSPASAKSRSRSRSADSHKSAHSRKSRARSRSAPSNAAKSRSGSRSKSSSRSRSGSPASNRSRSRSGTPHSNRSGGSAKSRSRSNSGSRKSRSRSKSGSHKSRSRSRSGSRKSRSRSGSVKSRSRSKSGSHKSRSRSRSGSRKSRSRSKSGESQRSRTRSRSGSVGSNKSGHNSHHSGSRSRSHSPDKNASKDRSRSNSPSLQIDEPGSPESGKSPSTGTGEGGAGGDKRKRESSEEVEVKKKSRVIDTDSEAEPEKEGEDAAAEKPVNAASIFGDADDISSEEEKDKEDDGRKARRYSGEDVPRVGAEEEDDEEEREGGGEGGGGGGEAEKEPEPEPEPIPETRIDVKIPKISCDLGRDIHFVKLPNFLSVETRPFDPETYEDEIDEEETLDEEGRARLKLKVENTIRWKEFMDDEGNMKKQSNARLVRWSDGSYSLHLGSEIFDVYKQPLQGDHNHLFIRQGTGLQGQAVFRTKLSFRPHSTESFTHRKMTLSLADRSQKTSGIKILSQVGADPDQDRKQLLKKEEEKLRQTVKVSKPRRKDGSRAHSSSNVYREEDGSDEDGAISLNAIKNKYKTGAGAAGAPKGGAIYSSDEEGSDFEGRRSRKVDKAKVLKDSDDSEESE